MKKAGVFCRKGIGHPLALFAAAVGKPFLTEFFTTHHRQGHRPPLRAKSRMRKGMTRRTPPLALFSLHYLSIKFTKSLAKETVLRYNVTWIRMDICFYLFILLTVHHTSSGSLPWVHATPCRACRRALPFGPSCSPNRMIGDTLPIITHLPFIIVQQII